MKPSRLALALAASVFPATAAAAADARATLRRFAEQQASDRGGPASLVGRATLPGGQLDAPLTLDLTGAACRLRLDGPEGASAVNSATRPAETSGPLAAELGALASLACPWLAIRGLSPAEAEAQAGRAMGQLGAALGTSAISRTDRRTAVVVGAKAGERERPQAWFDKESGRLLRVSGRAGGATWEVRFVDAGSLATGRRAPRGLELFRAGEKRLSVRLMTAQAESAATAPAASDESVDDPD